MILTATKIKMPYQNQLLNQLSPGSNFIKKKWVAHNRARAKVGTKKTIFTNGESAQPVLAKMQVTKNGAHP